LFDLFLIIFSFSWISTCSIITKTSGAFSISCKISGVLKVDGDVIVGEFGGELGESNNVLICSRIGAIIL